MKCYTISWTKENDGEKRGEEGGKEKRRKRRQRWRCCGKDKAVEEGRKRVHERERAREIEKYNKDK